MNNLYFNLIPTVDFLEILSLSSCESPPSYQKPTLSARNAASKQYSRNRISAPYGKGLQGGLESGSLNPTNSFHRPS
jgi:hypothetical protein